MAGNPLQWVLVIETVNLFTGIPACSRVFGAFVANYQTSNHTRQRSLRLQAGRAWTVGRISWAVDRRPMNDLRPTVCDCKREDEARSCSRLRRLATRRYPPAAARPGPGPP